MTALMKVTMCKMLSPWQTPPHTMNNHMVIRWQLLWSDDNFMKLTSSGDNFLSFPLAPPNFISFLFISWLSDDLVVWLERSWLSDSRLPVVWLALSYCVVWLVPYCCLTRLGVVWLMLSDSQPCCLTRSSPVLSWTSRTPSLSSTQPRPTHRCSRFDRCCRGLPGRSFPRPPQQYLTESTAEGRDSLHWFQENL